MQDFTVESLNAMKCNSEQIKVQAIINPEIVASPLLQDSGTIKSFPGGRPSYFTFPQLDPNHLDAIVASVVILRPPPVEMR